MWSPIPSPNISAQGAGGGILPVLTTKLDTPTQDSRARNMIEGSVLFAIIFAILGTWYLNK